ncbi:glycoside hydrolase family 3 protein [Anaerostipes sp.]|uniref:glycoside hydrolase family 3 protein n=1 Tax=Anaerostipes sp. TaxID=1872530 RepID=UPI0025B9102C|nr:glycoside hydrolase family 3 N-terminal domain-containing protein [Anaerostipes sp.]
MMRRRIICMLLALCLLLCGCNIDGKKDYTKTEDLDEATLQGMAKDITKDLSLNQKIGQLFMVSVYSLESSGSKKQTKVTSAMKKTMKKYPVGGILLFSKNVVSKKQLTKLTQDLQNASHVPLFIAADEEGGTVSRIASKLPDAVTQYPDAKEIGETYTDQQIAKMGKEQSRQLKALGVNMNLAPVADVLSNKNNTEVGNRAFGSDAKEVASIVKTLVKSMQKQQISATLKHFPGSGDALGDTHRGPVDTKQTIQELRKKEFLPFESGMDADADAVMVSHLILTNVTDEKEPCSLSKRVISDILRDELEYDGLILTDAMNMNSITENYTSGEAAVKAVQAGVNMVVMPEDLGAAVKAVKSAVKSGRIKESAVDKAVRRIIYTKLKRGVIPPDTKLLEDNQ